jgi:Double zinc ribbon
MYDQATAAPPELEEVRCPQCGGLNRAGAKWCGQCLERFVPPKPLEIRGGRAGGGPPPPPPPPGSLQPREVLYEPPAPSDGKAFLVGKDGISWACKHCDTVNSIDTDLCSVCGMPFADLLRPVAPEGPKRDPNTVALISLFWPGAGHGYIGEWGQAIARGVVSLLVLVVATLSFVQAGLGAMTVTFTGISFLFWAVTAHDSFQEASNAPSRVVLKGRSMLWLVMGILVLLMGMLVVQGLQANAQVR